MVIEDRKIRLVQYISVIENEYLLQKIENLLQGFQENLVWQLATPIYKVLDIKELVQKQGSKTSNIKAVGGFWELPEEEYTESIEELLAQLNP